MPKNVKSLKSLRILNQHHAISTWSIIYEAHLLVIEYILKLLWVKHEGLQVIYSHIILHTHVVVLLKNFDKKVENDPKMSKK